MLAVAALWVGHAAAEQQFGVEVYPSAKPSPEVNEFFAKQLKINDFATPSAK